jgi:hypothetical protein
MDWKKPPPVGFGLSDDVALSLVMLCESLLGALLSVLVRLPLPFVAFTIAPTGVFGGKCAVESVGVGGVIVVIGAASGDSENLVVNLTPTDIRRLAAATAPGTAAAGPAAETGDISLASEVLTDTLPTRRLRSSEGRNSPADVDGRASSVVGLFVFSSNWDFPAVSKDAFVCASAAIGDVLRRPKFLDFPDVLFDAVVGVVGTEDRYAVGSLWRRFEGLELLAE